MAKASEVMTREARKPSHVEGIMGGLGGTLSTADLVKARAAYNEYAIEVGTSGGDRKTFEEFVQTEWKPKK